MKKIVNDLVYYKFSIFDQYDHELKHLISTRIGGKSLPPYESLNVGLHVGDRKEDVINNRDRICKKLGYSIDSLVAMKHVHSTNVHVISSSDKGKGAKDWSDGLQDTDCVVTNMKDVILFSATADCSVSILFDPRQNVLGICHAGWKGVRDNIIANTIFKMENQFKCSRGDIIVGIGPAICSKCYDLKEEVADGFERQFSGKSRDILRRGADGKRYLQISKAIEAQLISSGIKGDHIEDSGLCTSCMVHEFYSYKKENEMTGRTGIFAILTQDKH